MLPTRNPFWEALDDWRTAVAAFNEADAECLDSAIDQLQAAEANLASALRRARSNAPDPEVPDRPPRRHRLPSRGSKEPRD